VRRGARARARAGARARARARARVTAPAAVAIARTRTAQNHTNHQNEWVEKKKSEEWEARTDCASDASAAANGANRQTCKAHQPTHNQESSEKVWNGGSCGTARYHTNTNATDSALKAGLIGRMRSSMTQERTANFWLFFPCICVNALLCFSLFLALLFSPCFVVAFALLRFALLYA
jgi:hypothetical protein